MGIIDKIKQRESAPAAKSVKASAKPEAKETAPAKKKAEKPVKGPLAKEAGGRSALVLKAPVLTEKSGRQESIGKYCFLVADGASKTEVAAAVRDLYGVKPTAVRIMNVKGKPVRFGRRQGQKSGCRKAIVTLKKGDTISLYQ